MIVRLSAIHHEFPARSFFELDAINADEAVSIARSAGFLVIDVIDRDESVDWNDAVRQDFGGDYEITVDAVELPCTISDLERLLAATHVIERPLDRNLQLEKIVGYSYVRRSDPAMKSLCVKAAIVHAQFVDSVARVERTTGAVQGGGSFRMLATILVEDGEFDGAIQVCQSAINLGLNDGTEGGFTARIRRIRKYQMDSNPKAKPIRREVQKPSRDEHDHSPHSVASGQQYVGVPACGPYISSTQQMSTNQRTFYKFLASEISNGRFPPVGGNVGYLMVYCFGLVERWTVIGFEKLKYQLDG